MKVDKQIDRIIDSQFVFCMGEKSGSISQPHAHSEGYQIEILISGTAKNLNVPSSELITPGKINIYNPDDPHQLDYKDTDSFYLFVETSKINSVLNALDQKIANPLIPSHRCYDLHLPKEMVIDHARQLESIGQYRSDNLDDHMTREFEREKAHSLLNVVLRSLLPDIKQKSWDYRQGYHDLVIKRAIDWIESNYSSDDIQLSHLAEAIGLSEFHFSRVFKTKIGKSPIEYLRDVRIRHIKSLMREKNLRLIDLAVAVGFKSVKQMNLHFKKVTGLTAAEYRGKL